MTVAQDASGAPGRGEPRTEGPAEAGGDPAASPEGWISRNRYVLLSTALILLAVSYHLKSQWPGGIDIWEHAAAARELGAHPLHPGHPLLPVHRLHQFFSPYLWVVGVLGRLSRVTVVTALDVAAFFNLVLLLISLRLFVRRLTPRPHVDFFALLFIVFLWGPDAWFFSGFLHFNVLVIVLSYPSTFAKGLVLLSLWAHLHYLESDDERWLLPTLLLSAVVLLTHPVDAVFLGIGVVALALTRSPTLPLRHVVLTVLTLAGSLLLAFAWPLLPLYQLLFGSATAGYRASIGAADHEMYTRVLTALGPALVVVPFALRRMKARRPDPLVVMLVGTLLAYAFGYVTHDWSFGRLISSAQIVGAILLADERALIVRGAAAMARGGRAVVRVVQVVTLALVLVGTYDVRNGFDAMPEAVLARLPANLVYSFVDKVDISDFDFLAAHHRTYPVVISDLYTSLELPTFGSKVVAFARTQAFVDTTERGEDLAVFYSPSSTTEVRRSIIAKYGASLLVVPVDKLAAEPDLYIPLVELGTVVSRNERFVFVDLRGG
ncbi:MAG TPA: hypothetical protein VHT97_04820 [Acidimicrobiales bacterium]|nr:hypothetical protein [Acidimicrobiales bacterium]